MRTSINAFMQITDDESNIDDGSNIDDEWMQFLNGPSDECANEHGVETNTLQRFNYANLKRQVPLNAVPPKSSDIYISTRTIITFLKTNNRRAPIDLDIFWKIPILQYSIPKEGVIKKEIKINSKTPDELKQVLDKLPSNGFVEQNIMSHIDNPSGRVKFKDVRKISIGISKKDVLKCKKKTKKAFYNCIVLMFRIKMDIFREFHVKLFNTGKVEIPGMKSDEMFETVVTHLINAIQPFYNTPLTRATNTETVLINSNFKCNYFVNREIIADILKNKYNLCTIYDPCSYPGVKCKFYYDPTIDAESQTGHYKETAVKVPFMIFRTGSVLIVGKCLDQMLHSIYNFVKKLLMDEYPFIYQPGVQMDNNNANDNEIMSVSAKTLKRKKKIFIPKV